MRSRSAIGAVACLAVSFALPLSAQTPSSTAVGGYGEVHYTNRTGANTPGEVNVRRFVVFLAHTFNDRLAFRSELEVEDAKVEGGSPGGEVALEQVYVDYRLGRGATIRTGLLLIPIGIVNEVHEPPTFNGVARPLYHRNVIPTTWREIGTGVVGNLPVEGLAYRAYVVNGLLASGMSSSTGIRGGRQEGREANFANPSLTGRIEYARPGIKVGGAFWHGATDGGDTLLGAKANLTVLAADVRWDSGPFAIRAEAASISLGDAQNVNAAYGGGLGSAIRGGYIEGAFNALRVLAPASNSRLNIFARHERFDTHASVPAGTTRDGVNAQRVTTLGVTYLPIPQVAFKADYQLARNRAAAGEDEVLSLGVGYWF